MSGQGGMAQPYGGMGLQSGMGGGNPTLPSSQPGGIQNQGQPSGMGSPMGGLGGMRNMGMGIQSGMGGGNPFGNSQFSYSPNYGTPQLRPEWQNGGWTAGGPPPLPSWMQSNPQFSGGQGQAMPSMGGMTQGGPTGAPQVQPGAQAPGGGNSNSAILQAMATGNQSGLSGAGTQGTNAQINNAFYQQGVANPYYQQNQVALNRQGPMYRPGGMFYNPAIDGQ